MCVRVCAISGRRKASTANMSDLLWTGQCLYDPSASACGARGFTLSMWMKIITVSDTRLRFYLNTGDSGIGDDRMADNRGVAIFTDGPLFGISVSGKRRGWKVILSEDSYQTGEV